MIEVLQKRISEKFTMDVLRGIARKETGWETAIVKDIILGSEPKKGDSYLSAITRFTAEVSPGPGEGDELQKIHVIAKGLPSNLARRETFRSVDFFRNEVAFFTKVWPALEKFEKSKSVAKPIRAIPKCYSAFSDGSLDYVAMEDLTKRGYKPYTRSKTLDFDESVEVLYLFGKFHALSLAFKEQCPEEFSAAANALQETYFAENIRYWYTPTMVRMYKILRDAVTHNLPDYLEKLDNVYKEDVYGEAAKECQDCNPLSGITHGDCWAPNFLAKCENGVPHIKVIDYQVARCASVTMDIAYLLYVCVEPSIRDCRWDELLKEYQYAIATALDEYGSDGSFISIDLIKENMRNVRHSTLLISLESVVVSNVEDEHVADLDSVENETTVEKVYKLQWVTNEEKRKNLAGFFKHMYDHNFA